MSTPTRVQDVSARATIHPHLGIAIESVGEMTLPVRGQAERSPRAY